MRLPLLLLLPAPLLLGGCVERFLSIRSAPPGAQVLVDGELVGRTPVEVPFVWYGKREVLLYLAGHQSHRQEVDLNAPFWQIFPLDFLTDVVIPVRLVDRHTLEVTLTPSEAGEEERDRLRERALEERRKVEGK